MMLLQEMSSQEIEDEEMQIVHDIDEEVIDEEEVNHIEIDDEPGNEMGSSSQEKIREDVEDEIYELKEGETFEISVGMEFESVEELYDYWKVYASLKGFPVRKRSSHKVDGVVKYVRYACAREGNKGSTTLNPIRPRPLCGLGCKVQMSAKLLSNGKWEIIKAFLDHNHECSPFKSRLFRCNRYLSERDKRDLAIRDQAGVSVPDSFRVSVEEKGGHENVPYISKDARNFVEKMRRLRLGEGDAVAIRNYFLKMQMQNKDFYFNLDIDEYGRLENVFWADARSRLAYKEFGEVVTFDTTYLTNKYDMPFAPFVGVNHHGQSMLLGCGLVSHENTDTFIWLFNTWLACMNGCAPRGIITDQDRAMQKAIAKVFPNTVHRWCLWHIMKKLPDKLKGHNHYESIYHDMHVAVYDSQLPNDFEESWNEMISKYKLEDNSWLCGLYDEKRRWVPTFVKTTFWAGMSTTQRSESMNAFFDKYVNQKTTLKQFVERYDSALRCKIEKETQEDCRSFSVMIPLTTTFGIEKQVQSVYTLAKFREFQNELNAQGYCRLVSKQQEGSSIVYEIKERIMYEDGRLKNPIFTVSYNSNQGEIECSCHMFEYRGTICKHTIWVLIDNEVELLPDKYILRRWRKDVKRSYSRILVTNNGWVVTTEHKRYDEMCTIFTEIADLASLDEQDSCEVLEWAKSQKKKLKQQRSKSGSNTNPLNPRKIIDDVEAPSDYTSIKDPAISNRKGRSKGRYVGTSEQESNKAKKRHLKAATKAKEGNNLKGKKTIGGTSGVTIEEEAPTQDSIVSNVAQMGVDTSCMISNTVTYQFLDTDMDSFLDGRNG